jgi:hypothetical protein|tara:strand:- start:640 stop:840 length:201 start_codon:yes stop_codon:yes gene_type:complete
VAYISKEAGGRSMRIIQTDCTQEQIEQDLPELERLNAEAMETEFMWEFFGGVITLNNGNKYQVIST